MSRVTDMAKRLLGRSVVDLAGAVDDALADLSLCELAEQQAGEALAIAKSQRVDAQARVASARDDLFREHPALRPEGWNDMPLSKASSPAPEQPGPPGAWDPEPIDVDDDSDPRYTSGAPAASTNDSDPLPPLDFQERTGGFDGE